MPHGKSPGDTPGLSQLSIKTRIETKSGEW